MDHLKNFVDQYLYWVSLPKISLIDILEIIILAFFLYHIILWFKETRAWTLFKGILLIALFAIIAYVLQMNTILWLINKTVNVGLIAIIVIFQPELRRALDRLGQGGFLSAIFPFETNKNNTERFSDRTINELVRACFEMGKSKTGALIVMEKRVSLKEYEETGIEVDAIVSASLLINIFEHNTPLHDGAVIMRGNRVTAATCYLPLSDTMQLSKALGTRHRAGLGVSELTDSLTIIVSEETGAVSLAQNGVLYHNVTPEHLRAELKKIQNPSESSEDGKKKRRGWKGRARHEKDADRKLEH